MKLIYLVMNVEEEWNWNGEDSVRSETVTPGCAFVDAVDAAAWATRRVFPHEPNNDPIFTVNLYEPGEKP